MPLSAAPRFACRLQTEYLALEGWNVQPFQFRHKLFPARQFDEVAYDTATSHFARSIGTRALVPLLGTIYKPTNPMNCQGQGGALRGPDALSDCRSGPGFYGVFRNFKSSVGTRILRADLHHESIFLS